MTKSVAVNPNVVTGIAVALAVSWFFTIGVIAMAGHDERRSHEDYRRYVKVCATTAEDAAEMRACLGELNRGVEK